MERQERVCAGSTDVKARASCRTARTNDDNGGNQHRYQKTNGYAKALSAVSSRMASRAAWIRGVGVKGEVSSGSEGEAMESS